MRWGSDLSIGWSRSMPVSTEPGQIVITRMPSFRTSSISERPNPSTACLEAVYAVPPTKPFRPARLATFTMVPSRRRRMRGQDGAGHEKRLRRLVAIVRVPVLERELLERAGR